MAKEKDNLKQLLTQYVSGTINLSDLNDLLDYISLPGEDREQNAFMEELLEEMEIDRDELIDSVGLYQRITSHSNFRQKKNLSKAGSLYWLSGVAAVLLFIGISLLYVYDFSRETSSLELEPAITSISGPTIDHGKSAVLRLADGTIIDLDNASSGLLATQENMEITLRGTELHYQGSDVNNKGNTGLNTITTPRGRQYQLVLPDGSKIWLNAASTLTYPVHFKDDVRTVEISGEAYFEVKRAKDWPFIVKTAAQQIEVLGTHFNVSAYDEDQVTKTTLMEGKIKIVLPSAGFERSSEKQIQTSKSIILTPGEQAITPNGNLDINVKRVDIKEAVSWKQNVFAFNNEEIKEVMKKVSRWYDVEVEYVDGMANKRIGGSIPRFENVENVMEALEATGLLHYKKEGRRLIIMK